jgi:putative PIN family toxin of toxin-antitoxin system
MLPLRLVIDTNVLVSAALNPDGLQRTTILIAITKPARLYVSPPILKEYAGVLARSQLKIRKGVRLELLQLIKKSSHMVVLSQRFEVRATEMTTYFWNARTKPVLTTSLTATRSICRNFGRRPRPSHPGSSSPSRHLICLREQEPSG